MLTISIALCIFNGENFLREQLLSIQKQDLLPDELVICDDASTDCSLQIAKEFAKIAPFKVVVISNSNNIGYVKNFERAISFCIKDIVFMCDQDDIWAPSKLITVMTIFNAEPSVGLILHDFSLIDSNNRLLPEPTDTYGINCLSVVELPKEIKENSIFIFMDPYPRAWCGNMMAFRNSYCDILLPIFPGKGHDDWILKVLGPITNVRFVSNKLIQYRMHSTNTNRRDLDKKTFFYLLKRFIKKLLLVMKGYTKHGFYLEILRRVKDSKYPIIYPKLISRYRIWTSRF